MIVSDVCFEKAPAPSTLRVSNPTIVTLTLSPAPRWHELLSHYPTLISDEFFDELLRKTLKKDQPILCKV